MKGDDDEKMNGFLKGFKETFANPLCFRIVACMSLNFILNSRKGAALWPCKRVVSLQELDVLQSKARVCVRP